MRNTEVIMVTITGLGQYFGNSINLARWRKESDEGTGGKKRWRSQGGEILGLTRSFFCALLVNPGVESLWRQGEGVSNAARKKSIQRLKLNHQAIRHFQGEAALHNRPLRREEQKVRKSPRRARRVEWPKEGSAGSAWHSRVKRPLEDAVKGGVPSTPAAEIRFLREERDKKQQRWEGKERIDLQTKKYFKKDAATGVRGPKHVEPGKSTA